MADKRPPVVSETAADRARSFLVFCDGAEDSGSVAYARRGRDLARELLEALDQLEAERSVREALQARIARLEGLLLARQPMPPADVERAELEQRLRDADVTFAAALPLEQLRELAALTGAAAT
jgi:hypothetical protein